MVNLDPNDKYFDPLRNQWDIFIMYHQQYKVLHFLYLSLDASYLLSAYSDYIKNSIDFS